MNQGNSGMGRGRGRGGSFPNGNPPFNPWNPRGSSQNKKLGAKNAERQILKEKVPTKILNEKDEWKSRETASEYRLEKARNIRKAAAEKFSHLLEDTDSSDEEIKDEEIMKKMMNNYSKQFNDEESDLPEPCKFLSDMLQAGEIICPVCIDPVKHTDPVWSCKKCFGLFHIQCIQRWARQLVGAEKIARDDISAEENFLWCCPNCRHNYKQTECPSKYFCFCGKEEDPSFNPWTIPHSCGQKCAKLLTPVCGHECLLLCHPGPCLPCPKTVKMKCHCGRSDPSTRRCYKKEWSCGSVCGKMLSCGHHRCKNPCHSGDCLPCPEKSFQPCLCLKNKELRDCAEPMWKCKETCGKILSCGNHTCEDVCHRGKCSDCPRTGKRSCPCGKMILQLPCTEDIPPCEDTCGKLLECGRHYCHRQCHTGACETCRQIVTKTCRCGKCSKELPCCQLFTCDFKCTKMRSCQRHPCKRKCCDGNCPPCEQTCNRQLSCRNHKCPAQCHTGFCFPCPLRKDVKCFCESTKISVNCGAERSTKPPKCKQPCKIPSSCHHKTREYHLCHFKRCPPCKQTCDIKLEPCGHTCPSRCHDEVPVRKPNKPNLSSERKPREEFDFILSPCPPCIVPLPRECFGNHEVSTFPCSKDKPYSCKRKCGRDLPCGNHQCERECHVVLDAISEKEAGSDCLPCEEPCLKPRPNGCTHVCKKPCHPGECPSCAAFVRISCHCGLMMMELNCYILYSENEETMAAKSCKTRCAKLLKCGHRCPKICHPGACPEPVICNQKLKLFCSCKRKKKEQRCNVVQNSGELSLECDEKCEELKNESKKEEERKEAALKAEQLKKQQEELEWFERKMKGRKRKHKPVKIEDEKSFFSKHKYLISISVFVALISAVLFFLLQNE